MDRILDSKLGGLKEKLKKLMEALAERPNKLVRDSVIKRFEYTFELAWKSGKILLSKKFGTDVFSPKEVWRELRKNRLLSDTETETALKMTDDRNEIIHTYSEETSNDLYRQIRQKYFSLLKKILLNLEKK